MKSGYETHGDYSHPMSCLHMRTQHYILIDAVTILLTMFMLSPVVALSANYYSASSGAWNTANRWNVNGGCGGAGNSGAAYPGSAATSDTATICNNHAVTLPITPANPITALTIGSSCANASSLASATTNVALTVNGNVSLACANSTLSFNGASGVFTLTVNGNITNAGTVSVSANNRVHVLNVSGNITNNNIFDLFTNASRVANLTFTGGATHTLSGSGATTEFNNVTVNNNFIVNMGASGTTVTQTGTLTINGTLDVQGGTYNLVNFVSVTGTTTIDGSAAVTATLGITGTTSTKTFSGLVTVNAFGTWSNAVATGIAFSSGLDINNDGGGNNGTFTTSSTGTYTISGGGLSNDGTFTSSSTSGFTFDTTSQDIVCSVAHPISIATITVTGVTLTNKCDATPSSQTTLTVRTALSGTGGLTQDTNASLTLGGTSGITTLTADATGNAVTYSLAGAQTVKLPAGGNYFNLTLSGSGNKTSVTGTYNILGDMTVNSGPTWVGTGGAPDPAVNITGNLKIDGSFTTGTGAYTLEGDFENNGTFTHTAGGTFTMDGTTAGQTIKGTTAATFRSLTISNTHAAGVSATTNFNVGTTLTVSANALLVPDAGVVINNAAAAGAITGSGTIEVTRTAATADYVNQYKFTTNTLSGLTVKYSGAGAQTINASATVGTYGSLIASNSGTKTLGGNVTVNTSGTLSVATSGVVLDMATFTANCTATGTISVVDGATLKIGSTNGFPTGYTTTSLTSASTVEYYGANQSVGGVAYGNLTLSTSGTKTLAATATVAGNLSVNTSGVTFDLATFTANGSGTLTVVNGATLKIGGTNGFPAGYASTSLGTTSTVDYYGTNQSVGGVAYGNLTLSTSGTKTLAATATVAGNLTVNTSGVTFDLATFTANGSGTLTVVNGATLKIGGTNGFPSGYATTTLGGTSTVEYSGTTQNLGALTYGNLTISGSGTKTLAGNATTNATLTLNNGLVNTSTNQLTIGSSGSVTRSGGCTGTSCFVVGNLVKNVATGSPTVTWEVGTETASPAYAPVSITFTGAAAGNFQVTTPTAAGDHADTSAGISGVDATKSVNRYWTFTRLTGSSTSYAPTFSYGNIAGDVDGGATPSSFIIGQKSGGSWEYPTVSGTPTGNSASATGVIDANGDDFVIGEAYLSLTPFSQWRMNQFAWNGTANEVLDTGSGGNHGTAAGLSTKPTTAATSPAIAGSPGTCQYGVFNRSNKDYIALPSGYPNLSAAAGGFTITAWIQSTNVSNTGQRIMIDDESNVNGEWGLTLGEPGAGRLRFYYRQASTFNLDTPAGSPLANNTWYFVAVTVRLKASGPGSKAEIFVYNTSGTLVTSASSNFTATSFASDSTPPSIGGETNAASENTSAYGFAGNIDMVSVYQGDLAAEHINQIRQLTHNCVFLDHIRIEHDGLGLTCAPETVTIEACTDSICSSTYTGSVTTTLSPTGWVGGDTINFSGGSTTAQLSHTTAETVTLGAGSTLPPPTNGSRCFIGVTETCAMEFKDSGFIFDVPNLTAYKDSPSVTISAVRKDLTSQTCAPAFTGSKTVNFWSTYSNPASGTRNVKVNSTSVATSSPGTGISLNFNASAQATFTVNYPDAGQMTLDASYTGSGSESGLVMSGNDQFISVPAGLCVEATDAGSGASCTSNFDTCPVFKKAGETFNLTVRAVGWESDGESNTQFCSGNGDTPNFKLNSIPLNTTVVAPATGSNGTPGVNNVDVTSNGSYSAANETISEVGVFTITATPPAYLGQTLAASTSANLGRFKPDRFNVTANTPTLQNGCPAGSYTYMDKNFYFATPPILTITARNKNGTTTMNYGGSFWKLNSSLASRSYSDQVSGADHTFAGTPASAVTLGGDTDYDGTGTLATAAGSSGDVLRYGRVSPKAPFVADINLNVTAADLTDSDGVCYDATADGTCDSYTISNIGGASLRFGRLKIGSEVSSESMGITAAPMLKTEYYNGTGYVTNTNDVCTGISATQLTLSSPYEPAETDGNVKICEAGGTTTMTVTNNPFVAGQGLLSFTPPGPACTGFADILIDLSTLNLNHLQFDWDDDDGLHNGPYDDNPRGRATFGIMSRPKEVIYTREPWN